MTTTCAPGDAALPRYVGTVCQIRPFAPDDLQAYHEVVRLPEVAKHMNWQAHASLDESRAFLQAVCASYGTDFCAPLCITTKQADACIGFVGFSKWVPEHRKADMAIVLHPSAWGQGIAREACRALIAYARQLGVVRLQAVVEVGNQGSEKLMDGLGPAERVRLGRYLVGKQGPVDAFVYAWFGESVAPSR